jgi:PAS domain-containing protein
VIAYPFVFLFFGAIMGSASVGGAIAGFLAVVLSSLLIDYFFIPPLFSISVAKDSQSFLAASTICAIGISMVSSARKRAKTAIRDARDLPEIRVQERTAELEQSNLELRESERQLRVLTEAIPQQIWRANSSGQIEYCNRHLREYIRDSTDVLDGESFFGVLHPEDEPLFRQDGSLHWLQAEDLRQRHGYEDLMKSTTGSSYAASHRELKMAGSPDGYGTHIEIEEQRRAQQKLLLAQEELARRSRTLSWPKWWHRSLMN